MKHEVFIVDRGGKEEKIVEQLDGIILVRWHRIRDGVSEAEVVIRDAGPGCRKILTQRGLAVRYEILIKRNGKRVHEGPIIRRHMQGPTVRLFVRDVGFFMQRTRCTQRWSSSFKDGGPDFVTERAMKIIKGEMAAWEAAGANFLDNIVVRETKDTAKTTRVTERYSQYVWDDLESMAADSGLDYTVVNRSLFLFDTHHFLGMAPRVTDEDFLAELEVVEYGLELGVISTTTDGMGHAASTTVEDDYYGPVALLAMAYTATTSTERVPHEELVAQAKRNARSRYPAPVVLRVPENAQVRPDRVEDLMDWFVPGTGFPVYSISSGMEIEQVQKLDRVEFEETEAGETVRVTLSAAPVGSNIDGLETT